MLVRVISFFCTKINYLSIVVVARIHFSQDRYVVQEAGPSICVEVINDDYPADQDFAVTFTFSKFLLAYLILQNDHL